MIIFFCYLLICVSVLYLHVLYLLCRVDLQLIAICTSIRPPTVRFPSLSAQSIVILRPRIVDKGFDHLIRFCTFDLARTNATWGVFYLADP